MLHYEDTYWKISSRIMPFNLSICEQTLETGYWSWRNTTVNILAVLIVFCNSLLIYVIRSSNTLRKQVHLQKLWIKSNYCRNFANTLIPFLSVSTSWWRLWPALTCSAASSSPSTHSGSAGQRSSRRNFPKSDRTSSIYIVFFWSTSYFILNNPRWQLGRYACQVVTSAVVVLMSTSIYNFICANLDRCRHNIVLYRLY